MLTIQFVLLDKQTGALVAGPFAKIDHVPKDTDWDKVDLKITDWVRSDVGRII